MIEFLAFILSLTVAETLELVINLAVLSWAVRLCLKYCVLAPIAEFLSRKNKQVIDK